MASPAELLVCSAYIWELSPNFGRPGVAPLMLLPSLRYAGVSGIPSLFADDRLRLFLVTLFINGVNSLFAGGPFGSSRSGSRPRTRGVLMLVPLPRRAFCMSSIKSWLLEGGAKDFSGETSSSLPSPLVRYVSLPAKVWGVLM